jgi:hypothetical protein
MTFRCEDLREHGLILVPNTSTEYDPLLEDIGRRIENPPPGMPPGLHRMLVQAIDPEKRSTSAILLNQSGETIVSMEIVWRYEQADGRIVTGTRSWNDVIPAPGHRPSSAMLYWNHILPGSKRYIGEDRVVGDNSDVRPPPAEEAPGGGGGGSAAGTGYRRPGIVSVTLALTGVFFPKGEFAGSEASELWQRSIAKVALWQEAGAILQAGHGFDRVEALTGPATLPPPAPRDWRGRVRRSVGRTIAWQRERFGDAEARHRLISYIATALPELRRL